MANKTALLLLCLLSVSTVPAQDIGHTEPVDAARLTGARLKSIRSSARWAFGRTRFEVTFRADRPAGHGYTNDDRVLAQKLTNRSVFSPASVSGRWALSEDDDQLLLTGLKSDGRALADVEFPIEGAGPFRANIGPMQFHIDEFGGSYAGSYVGPGGSRLTISPGKNRSRRIGATMTLVPGPGETTLDGPLVTRLAPDVETVRTATWNWAIQPKQKSISFSNIIVNGDDPQSKGFLVELGPHDEPNSLELAGAVFVREPPPPTSWRLLTYNVWYGFTNAPERKKEWLRWVEDQVPDVVVLQELNKYTARQLAEDADYWGHKYSVLLKEDGFPTGITSLTPITGVKKFRDGFHHGLMRVQTAGYYVYVVHLHPSNWEVRIREARLLIEDAKKLPKGAKIIIAGDFNTFSPLDAEHYATLPDIEPFFGRLDARAKGRAKNLRDGKLDYTPLKLFAEAGFVDQEARFRKKFQGTFPTQIEKEGEHGDLRRLDYVLTDPSTSARVIRAWSVLDRDTHKLSDHYPLIVDIQPESTDPPIQTAPADSHKKVADLVRRLMRAMALGNREMAQQVCVPGADLSPIPESAKPPTDEQLKKVNEMLDRIKIVRLASSPVLDWYTARLERSVYLVPVRKADRGPKCDPRWCFGFGGRDDDRIQTARMLLAGFHVKDPGIINAYATPGDDNWMLSYGRELPGADRGIMMESAGYAPFIILRAGERYFSAGKLQTVAKDEIITLGVEGALRDPVVEMKLAKSETSSSGWRANPVGLFRMIRPTMKKVDADQGRRAATTKLLRRSLVRIVFAKDAREQLTGLLATKPGKEVLDEAQFLALQRLGRDTNFATDEEKQKASDLCVAMLTDLLNAGANPNAMNAEGDRTVLISACRLPEDTGLPVARLLLKRGADPRKKAGEESPLQWAKMTFSDETRKLLENAMK